MGWFKYSGSPSKEELRDDLQLFHQHQLNLTKFFIKFFDNLKSNYYQDLITTQGAEKVFDYVFKSKLILFDDIQRFKVFKIQLNKMLNYNRDENQFLQAYKDYVFNQLVD